MFELICAAQLQRGSYLWSLVQGMALQAITMQTWLKEIQQALSQGSEENKLAMPDKMAASWRTHTVLEHYPPLVGF